MKVSKTPIFTFLCKAYKLSDKFRGLQCEKRSTGEQMLSSRFLRLMRFLIKISPIDPAITMKCVWRFVYNFRANSCS